MQFGCFEFTGQHLAVFQFYEATFWQELFGYMGFDPTESFTNGDMCVRVGFLWFARVLHVTMPPNDHDAFPCLWRAVICSVQRVRCQDIVGEFAACLGDLAEYLKLRRLQELRDILEDKVLRGGKGHGFCIVTPHLISGVVCVLTTKRREPLTGRSTDDEIDFRDRVGLEPILDSALVHNVPEDLFVRFSSGSIHFDCASDSVSRAGFVEALRQPAGACEEVEYLDRRFVRAHR
ncbi:hypothetical protein RQN9TF_20485 [Rhodococcus qingshengii]|nr:hypothetical protein RQN9TF_20485 [Rhodococcus qingshengii]